MLRNLIFFVCLFLFSCKENEKAIKIIWTEGRATGIKIPHSLIDDESEPKLSIEVRLQSEPVAMLGSFKQDGEDIIFEPLIPFTRELSYEILVKSKKVGEIKIPATDAVLAPELLAVYPTQDTVPANWLKMYMKFSKPMREGVSSKYIKLLTNHHDTVRGTFLDLQPELWNEDRTILTVWLDPGRIKRDLIPNKTMGTPLQEGKKYTLVIDDHWSDTDGAALKNVFRKDFFVSKRDDVSPDVGRWRINPVSSGRADELTIDLNEPLDYGVVMSSWRITDENKKTISGHWQMRDEERRIKFIPGQAWKAGRYIVHVEARAEDLAGNNLNRLFDQDVSKTSKDKLPEVVPIPFLVR